MRLPPLTITKKGNDKQRHTAKNKMTDWQIWIQRAFFYLPFRWVEDKKVSDRIIEIWPSIVKIVNHWSSLPPSKQPKCKSYEVLKNAVKDPSVVAKFNFFSFLAGRLLPYLTRYQSQKPMIPFLHDDIQQLVKELLSLTIKSEVIDNCKEDYKALLKIDLHDVSNHIKKKDMHVGFWYLGWASVSSLKERI